MANPWDFDTIWSSYCEDYPDFGEGSDCPEEPEVADLTPAPAPTCAYLSGGEIRQFVTEISGLWHLEGQVVSIVTDGGEHPSRTVVNGKITLDYPASIVHVGLPYKGLIRTMNLEAGGANGPSQTKPKNINRLGIRFLNTLGARYGTDLYKMQEIYFHASEDNTGRPAPLFSGDKILDVNDITSPEKRIYIQQLKPLPCTVLLMSPYVDTNNE